MFKHEAKVKIKPFDYVVLVKATLTDKAYAVYLKDPEYIFTGKECFIPSRHEDMYAMPHYVNTVAIHVSSSDFKWESGKQNPVDMWAR